MKKTAFISFRTTKENEYFLKDIAEIDDRSVSSVLSKMIQHFRNKGDAKKTVIKLNS
jgi:hypothetical protein